MSGVAAMHVRVSVLSCLPIALALACRAAPPVEPETEGQAAIHPPELSTTESVPPPAAQPACTVTLDADGQLMVGDRLIPSDELWDPSLAADARVRSFPYTRDKILFALGTDNPWWPGAEDYPSGILWELPCDRPEDMVAFLDLPGADFSWAEMEPDGSALYFSDGAVQRYDFATRKYASVTTPPRISDCWMQEGTPISAIEYVAGWIGDDRMLIYWGGPCGFEAEWNGGTAVIENPRGTAKRRASGYVGSIAADASGRVWVSNGGRCVEQTGAWDLGERGVWRSDDVGESWTFVAIPTQQGVDAVSTSDGRVSVRTECCYSGAYDECEPQHLYSDDAGKTWKRDGGGQITPGRSVTVGEWVLEGTDDGVTKRRADEPPLHEGGSAGKTVLLPGVD